MNEGCALFPIFFSIFLYKIGLLYFFFSFPNNIDEKDTFQLVKEIIFILFLSDCNKYSFILFSINLDLKFFSINFQFSNS